jgi:hypothetical protein
MRPDPRKLIRLRRLERVRAIARQHAAAEAAAAETALDRIEGLALRTRQLRDACIESGQPADGFALVQRARFLAGLGGIEAATDRDARAARSRADQLQQELARAERRRAAVEERAERTRRELERRRSEAPATARTALGMARE